MQQPWDALELKAISWLNPCNRNQNADNKMIEYRHYSIFNLQSSIFNIPGLPGFGFRPIGPLVSIFIFGKKRGDWTTCLRKK